MPLDLGHDPARCLPALRPIAEVGVVPPNLDGRPADRAFEQMSDPLLQDVVGWQPDRILEAFGLQELLDLRVGEGGVGAEVAA